MKMLIAKFKIITFLLALGSAFSLNANIKTDIYTRSNDPERPGFQYVGNLDYSFMPDHEFAVRVMSRAPSPSCANSVGGNETYCITYPNSVILGQQFPMVVSIQNNVNATVMAAPPFDDFVPDPAQGPTFAPGLLFVSNTPASSGTFQPNAASFNNLGGKGSWFGFTLAPLATISVTMTIQATATGIQQYTASNQGNPNVLLPLVLIDVVACSLTASNTAIRDCVNTPVTGNLNNLITGASGAVSFAPLGAPFGGGVNILATGPFTFTPTTNFSGPAGFSFQVTDSAACTATASVGITVSSPIVGNTGLIDCSSSTLTGSLTGLASSGFPPYTFSETGPVIGGIVGVASNGIFTFTPTPGFNGLGGFSFQVTDSNLCIGTGRVNIALGSPTAAVTGITTCNNGVTGNLTTFVTGGTSPYTFSGPIGAVSCTGGSVTIAPSGSFSFTAPTGFTGPCSFTYLVTDSNGCSGNLGLTVNPNVSPIAQNASYSGCRNVPISQTLQVTGGVPPFTYSIVTPPANGTITSFNPTTGAFTYTPNVGFVGTDSFTFQATDSSTPACISNTGTITLVVNQCCPDATGPAAAFALYMQEQYAPTI